MPVICLADGAAVLPKLIKDSVVVWYYKVFFFFFLLEETNIHKSALSFFKI